MTWMDLGVASLIAATFLVLPGLLVLWVARVRGFLAVALAPAVSTTSIAGGAVVAGAVGISWAWWTPFAMSAAMAVIVWAVLALAGRAMGEGRSRKGVPAPHAELADLPFWLGSVLSTLLILRQLHVVLTRPNAFSQTFDNVFHLAAVRYAVDTGNASSLAISGVTRMDGGADFYPGAFHGLASLVMNAGQDDIALAVNAAAVAVAAIAWPLSCLALVRLVLPQSVVGVVGASILAASFAAFPILLLHFGILYPNLYGLALAPAMYGLVIQVLGLQTHRHVSPVTAGVLLIVMTPALMLAHPNALMVLVAAIAAPVLAWAARRWRGAWRPTRRGGALLLTGLLLASYVGASLFAWRVVRPPEAAAIWPPILSAPQALGEALLNATPGGGRAAWVLSVLVLAGVVVALRSERWWLVGSWAVIVGLWVVVASFGPSDLRSYLTGIWYNDPVRLAAALPIVALPLGALGIHVAGQRLSGGKGPDWLRRPETASGLQRTVGSAAVPVILLVPLVLGTQGGSYMKASLERASSSYALTEDSALVDTDEYALLQRLPDRVGREAVVATNPWNGSSMVYALTGIRTTTTHIFYPATEDQLVIRDELDEIAESPRACDAVKRMQVTHALDFGRREVHGFRNPYPGFLNLRGAEGFREIDREGRAVLYELTLCR